jgi:hypothetical protein
MATYGNQTTLLNTLTLPELTDLVKRQWITMQEEYPKNIQQLFITDSIPEGQGNTKRYNEIDTEKYADNKGEGANSKKAKTAVGYQIDMTAKTVSKEIDITLEMRRFNKYNEVGSLITSLGRFCENRMDLDLTHRLTFATASSYTDKNGDTVTTTVGDGNPLFYSTHTLSHSGTTYSNRVSGDPVFSSAALDAALLLSTYSILTNIGEKKNFRFNTIISGDDPATIKAIKQLIRSMADPDAIQSGITNTYKDYGFNHVILPDLATTAAGAFDSTKRRWWSVAATGQGMAGWQAYLGVWMTPQFLSPSDSNAGMDIHNYNWTYSTYAMYGICVPTGKGIIGSCPTS